MLLQSVEFNFNLLYTLVNESTKGEITMNTTANTKETPAITVQIGKRIKTLRLQHNMS